MRFLIIGLGILAGSVGVFMACASMDRGDRKDMDAQHLTAEITGLRQEISSLKNFPQSEPVRLDEAYTAFINDMHIIAGYHRAVCAISIEGKGGADAGGSSLSTEFPGLKEIRFHGVFSGIARRTMLLSLLDALDAFEKETPVLFHSISHEKDILAFDVTVMGI